MPADGRPFSLGLAEDLDETGKEAGKAVVVAEDGSTYALGEATGGGASAAEDVSFEPSGSIGATDVQAALEELDSEKQPLDSDLTAIAALVTAAYGRSLLTLANAAALLTSAGAAAAATTLTAGDGLSGGGDLSANRSLEVNVDDSTIEINSDSLRLKAGGVTVAHLSFDPATQAELNAAISGLSATYQPLDGDLTAIAALTTTAFGRALLTLADADALRTEVELETRDLIVTGDGSAGVTSGEPRVVLGVEVGGNSNAHFEVASPVNGVAYADFTVVGVDAACRIGYWDTDGEFRVEIGGHTLTFTDAGALLVDGSPVSGAAASLADVLAVGNDADALAITNLANPSDPQDAATKDYVDDGDAAEAAARAAAISALSSVYQALDPTLTALAAANWAANAIPVGSGSDALSQVALAANKFLARSSAGNVAAKDITDFALSLLDDADAVTARATLGVVAALFEDGGAQEISLAGLAGTSAALQAHLDDTSDAHDASAVSVADSGGNFTATDVEGVLAEIAPQLGGGSGAVSFVPAFFGGC